MSAADSASGSPGGTRIPVVGPGDVAVALDVRRDHRDGAAERAGQDHPEALAPDGRRDQQARLEQLLGQRLLRNRAQQVHVRVGEALAPHEPAHRERIGADHAQPRAGSPGDGRPGAQQNGQALPRLVAPDEDDLRKPARRIRHGRDDHAVREDLDRIADELARGVPAPAPRRRACGRCARRGSPTRPSRADTSAGSPRRCATWTRSGSRRERANTSR